MSNNPFNSYKRLNKRLVWENFSDYDLLPIFPRVWIFPMWSCNRLRPTYGRVGNRYKNYTYRAKILIVPKGFDNYLKECYKKHQNMVKIGQREGYIHVNRTFWNGIGIRIFPSFKLTDRFKRR